MDEQPDEEMHGRGDQGRDFHSFCVFTCPPVPRVQSIFVLSKWFLAQALLAKSLVISDQFHLQSLSLPQGFAGESKISNL